MEKKLILYFGPDYPKHIEDKVDILFVPIIDIIPINGSSKIFYEKLKKCDWIVFTSPRGPRILVDDAKDNNILDSIINEIQSKKLGVVGPETAKSVKKYLYKDVDLMPKSYTGKELANELIKIRTDCIILARSSQGVKDINEILEKNNKKFIEVSIYDEIVNSERLSQVNNYLHENKNIDYIILSSPLIAKAFCDYIRYTNINVIAIGPSTLKEVKDRCPFLNVIVPNEYTLNSAIELIYRNPSP
ncbi:uroporphyrinogen-III synthase [Caldisphaera lagunensis DSM 15908]|uniref:Uroporphyrinogen-III synthase n=1 Tax=Caldisphaera lagunensis (strain DSM 15908 / JCM 11604 / ANMR 0165 / IC-154) TaxID=1056495 RepID=L0ABS0_CALLD|nr:uroporphyrinogen-III synthase [Caldisphaera lagunensis]AFZ70874.1 uroporphyrinogen-III synthase [Caldisphaera lagunensis DSM 15908]